MKHVLPIIFLLNTVLLVFSSRHTYALQYNDSLSNKNNSSAIESVTPWSEINCYPKFPGGEAAMFEFIHKNLKYPHIDSLCGGIIYLSFIIEATGEVSNIKVERSACPTIDSEAIKVLEKLPRWQPGLSKGKAVRVKMNLPITIDIK